MKVYDIISESVSVDEAPLGMMKKMGAKLASKVPGAMGRRAAGNLESGAEANAVKKELATFMGRAGIGKGELTLPQLITFMSQKGYGDNVKSIAKSLRTPGTQASAPLDNPTVDKIIMKAVSGAAGAATTVGRGAYAAPVSKTGGSFKSSRTNSIPPQIMNAVSTMSPKQKAALAAMLGSNP